MELIFSNKKTEKEILKFSPILHFSVPFENNNSLIQGDNLSALSILLNEYNMATTNGTFSVGKNRTSTISASSEDEVAYTDTILGEEFLEFLRERLIFARELLSDNGSIYLHIDYKIGHYIKIIMDEIFGSENFRNDITRIKCNPKNFSRKAYGNIKDLILFYSKSKNPIWNEPFESYSKEDISRLYKKTDENGRAYTTVPLHAPGETKDGVTGGEFKGMKPPKGRHWRTSPEELEKLDSQGLIEWSVNGVPRRKIFADEQKGKKMQDIWDFKDYQYPVYPTEKNIDLLKHIVATSSRENSIVMDFFCGSGTTLCAAQELGRKWIGIDQSEQAIRIAKEKLENMQNSLFSEKKFDFIDLEGKNTKSKIAI